MKNIAVVLGLFLVGCGLPDSDQQAGQDQEVTCTDFPRWTYDASHEWPTDRSLLRPEDGAALHDGRVLVADEAVGLRVIQPDGTHRPFGQLVENGYSHEPPDFPGGATAVLLERDDRHALIGDVYTGRIYRVNVESEETSVIYDHPFGINGIVQDQTGALWFTQSTTNIPEQGVMGLFGGLNIPVPTGAVFRLPPEADGFATRADEVVAGLYFANGIAIDTSGSFLYVAELMMDRVLRYRLDVSAGTLTEREMHVRVVTPDNLAVDSDDNLWIASPGTNSVIVIDAACDSAHPVLRAPSSSNASIADAWVTRSHLSEPRLDLVTPEMWDPLPGALTGMFWSQDGRSVYFTGLGPAVLKYDR